MMALVTRLALREAWHDRRLFLCLVLAVAAVLTPLMILIGLKEGVIEGLRQQLLADPAKREIIIFGNRSYDQPFLDQLAARPEVAFLVPRTRTLALPVNLAPDDRSGRFVGAELVPTAPGDPLLPGLMARPLGRERVILSHSAAVRLNLQAGDRVRLSQTRIAREGNAPEPLILPVTVAALAPPEAHPREAIFADPALLSAVEDFLDQVDTTAANARPPHRYASFRLYARTLEDVAPLNEQLTRQGLDTATAAGEIRSVIELDRNLTLIYLIVALVGGLGYAVSLGTSLWANVERKRRDLSMLRLVGVPGRRLVWFPLIQAALVVVFGVVLSVALALLTGDLINRLYPMASAPELQVCRLAPTHVLIIAGASFLAAELGAVLAAWRVTRIEPCEGIRDV